MSTTSWTNFFEPLDLESERSDMAGAYNKLPLPTLHCSGIGVVPKKNGSWRLIMHLSWQT